MRRPARICSGDFQQYQCGNGVDLLIYSIVNQFTGAATDGDPVLYAISYLVQVLLDIKAKFIPPVNCRLIK